MDYSSQMRVYRWRKWWNQLPLMSRLIFILLVTISFLYIAPYAFGTSSSLSGSSPFPSSSDTATQMQYLIGWAKKEGLISPAIEIKMTYKGKTMYAKEAIEPGELFRVPYTMLLCMQLNDDPIVADSKGWILIKEYAKLEAHWTEALILLYEKQLGPHSKFFYYVDTMTKYEELPLPAFWEKEEDLLALEPASLREFMVTSPNEEVEEYWPQVVKMVQDNPEVFDQNVWNKRNFKWACAMVWCHAFNNDVNDEFYSSMAPVVDMMNHENEASTWWDLDEEKREWVLSSDQAFKKGDEVTISYGVMANVRLLKWFGFSVLDNTNDAYYYVMPWGRDDPLYKQKKSWMTSAWYDWIEIKEDKYNTLLAVARQATATLDEWTSELVGKISVLKKKGLPPFSKINCGNEKRTLEFLISTTEGFVKEYTTDIVTDEKLLAGNLPHNQRNAIVLRLGHKKILADLQRTLSVLLEDVKSCRDEEEL